MIQFIEGNLLESRAEALVNTVNTVGVMGKGIALQFKNAFPENYRIYSRACKEKTLDVGNLLITEAHTTTSGKQLIINFPTKTDWRKPSEYSYIESGLQALVQEIKTRKIKSIALPPLGAGNGGLEWSRVKALIEKYLSDLDCEVWVYQPNYVVKEVLRKERVALTPARAMLLAVMYDLVRNGEFVSEFAAEKIAYFLQRFGAKEVFKLDYQPNYYGPYSGKVKHVLYYLNGSYLSGYSTKDKKPFEELSLFMDAETDVLSYLTSQDDSAYIDVVNKTKNFLQGFYSDFGLELLSTLDFIAGNLSTNDEHAIIAQLEQWSKRKRTLFSDPKFISVAMKRLA
ncbi:MAG TPA: macro domain-containing protein, partial [Saprospiraceae bacterium]|nr:macro domain-containing protein [Saprospiraceae bacterium]